MYVRTTPVRRRPARGMTLIEILIVVVLIGMTTMFVAPKIDVTSYRINSAVQSIGTTLLAAQRLAITRQHDVVIGFDAAARTVRVLDDANDNGQRDPGEHATTLALGDAVTFGMSGAPAMSPAPGPITFTQVHDGLPSVTFHRDGSASAAGIVYLTSMRAGHLEDARAVEIERATGRVSWYRYFASRWKRGF